VCVTYSADDVTKKYGLPPYMLPLYFAMVGDSTDGIPGIKGIGKVQATAALQQVRSSRELFRRARTGELPGLSRGTQEKIAASEADFQRCLKLVTLREDLVDQYEIDEVALSENSPLRKYLTTNS
jgi:5'-3' exonuclease